MLRPVRDLEPWGPLTVVATANFNRNVDLHGLASYRLTSEPGAILTATDN